MGEPEVIELPLDQFSVVADPNVAKMCDLNHAEICMLPFCYRPKCAETKFLLKHVDRCTKKERCKYRDCALARILLDHTHRDHADHPDCPLCIKQTILKRLHPGKGPRRGTLDDDDDEEEVEVKRQKLNDVKENQPDNSKVVAAAAPLDLTTKEDQRVRQAIISPDLTPEQARMRMIVHAKTCRWDYCCKQCFWTKQLLTHIKTCYEWNCERKGCQVSKELLYHYRNCRPVNAQCELCAKKPDPAQYNGKDFFADLNPYVLRYVCGLLNKDEKTLTIVKTLNKRVQSFFQMPGEIKGLFTKTTCAQLRIEKTADGSMLFHFVNNEEKSVGFAHIFAESGAQERIPYSANKKPAAIKHIQERYGILEHVSAVKAIIPARAVPPPVYEALAVALQKFDFVELYLGSIIIDASFNDFFINGRNSKSEFRLHDRRMTLDNTSIK